ncbi:MAG: hypothetical protein R2867_12150 [Caldilineaceae bacterium]
MVTIIGENEMITLFEQQQQRVRHRGHATAEQHGIIGPFRVRSFASTTYGRIAISAQTLKASTSSQNMRSSKVIDEICRLLKGIDRSLHNWYG